MDTGLLSQDCLCLASACIALYCGQMTHIKFWYHQGLEGLHAWGSSGRDVGVSLYVLTELQDKR